MMIGSEMGLGVAFLIILFAINKGTWYSQAW
jgi:hypothetical protein